MPQATRRGEAREARAGSSQPPTDAGGESGLLAAVSSTQDGAVLTVVVVPRASTTTSAGVEGDAVRVRIAAPPVDGAANAALVRFVADAAGVQRSGVRVVAGGSGRRKRVLFAGLAPEDLGHRLRDLVPGS